MSPKKGLFSIGNTSEPTSDFQGDMLVFRGVYMYIYIYVYIFAVKIRVMN